MARSLESVSQELLAFRRRVVNLALAVRSHKYHEPGQQDPPSSSNMGSEGPPPPPGLPGPGVSAVSEPGLFLFTMEKKEKKDESGKQAAWVYKLFPLSSYWGCEEVRRSHILNAISHKDVFAFPMQPTQSVTLLPCVFGCLPFTSRAPV